MTIMARAAAVERSTQIDGKALAFANYALCLALARGDRGHAAEMFAARHPNSIHKNIIQKAATSAQTVADFVQADFKPFGDAFIDLLRPRSIVGQIQDAFVRVPFNIKVPRQTAGSSCGWTGEGRPAQLSALAFDNFEFEFAKIAGIVAFSKELAGQSAIGAQPTTVGTPGPGVQGIVFNDLSAVVAKFTDESFLDPGLDAVAGVSPASVTFGATNVPSTGITAAQIEADLGNLLAAITTDRTAVFLIMRRSTALAISRLRNATSGAVTFPGMTFNGGEIWGVPVIVSDNLPDDANSPQENIIVAIDASEILIADAGVELDVSENAILQMDSSPTHPIVAGTSVVSLWQHNLIAVRVLRFINWARRRSGAVAYISGVQV